MIFGSPVVGEVVGLVPTDASISAIDDLKGDELRFLFGVDGEVREVGFIRAGDGGDHRFS